MNKRGAPENLKGFVKGDKRINRKGRPKSFLALRELAQQIAHEEVTQQNGDARTVTELILRKWAASNDPRLQMQFIDVAFGKVPAVTEVGVTGTLKTENTHTHGIDGKTAANIFDILAESGVFNANDDDAKDDKIYPAPANT